MKVSDVPNDELNRFIANVFEPRPLDMHGIPPKLARIIWSENYAWKADWRISQHYDGDSTWYCHWFPLDFCTTGDGLKMMLEHMISKRINLEFRWCTNEKYPTMLALHAVKENQEIYSTWLKDVALSGRAVAETFALANGWKE